MDDLSPAMREALERLGRNMVWADGRSVRALIRRGLVKNYGGGSDALIGEFRIDVITDAGRAALAKDRLSALPRDEK